MPLDRNDMTDTLADLDSRRCAVCGEFPAIPVYCLELYGRNEVYHKATVCVACNPNYTEDHDGSQTKRPR